MKISIARIYAFWKRQQIKAVVQKEGFFLSGSPFTATFLMARIFLLITTDRSEELSRSGW